MTIFRAKPQATRRLRSARQGTVPPKWIIGANTGVAPAFKGVQAKPLVAYTPFEVLEGDGDFQGVVLFEFASMEEARQWYTRF